MPSAAELLSVNVGRPREISWRGQSVRTAIWKDPIPGRVAVRRLNEDGRFFACSDFRKQGSTDEYYDIDFWLDEKDGKISVKEVRVHKVPVLQDGNYVQVSRYSFDPK